MNKCHFSVVRLFLIIFLLFCMTGCTSTKIITESNISPIYITNVKKFYLLPPSCIENDVDAQQLLIANFGGNTFQMLSYLQADKNGIFLSLFNDFGTGMGNLSYDGIDVHFDSAVFPENLKAEYILADLQFAYYSVDAINETLKTIGMYMEVEKTEDGEIRSILSNSILPMMNSRTIEVIKKEKNCTLIQNILRGYEYFLQEAEQ
ncbi:MAG: DUF3261 domain-containing protein [Treponema sp.]|nr:DUF3261 domain-containing protein [Treponema sp.]